MHDTPKTASRHLEALLDEISQLRIANAEREQELSCIMALQQLAPRRDVSFDDQVQQMIDLVPHGFVSSQKPSARVQIFEHVFSTPGFQDALDAYSMPIHCDEQEIGMLSVQVSEDAESSARITREKERFLSLVAARFGECIQVRGMIVDAELAEQRLLEVNALKTALEQASKQTEELLRSVHEPIFVVDIWDGVVFVPITQILHAERAWTLMEKAFTAVVEKEPYFVIFDIHGVDEIDWTTAHYIVQALWGVHRWWNVTGVLTGVQPKVAQKILSLDGIHLGPVLVRGTLRDGLRECIRRMKIVRNHGQCRGASPKKRSIGKTR